MKWDAGFNAREHSARKKRRAALSSRQRLGRGAVGSVYLLAAFTPATAALAPRCRSDACSCCSGPGCLAHLQGFSLAKSAFDEVVEVRIPLENRVSRAQSELLGAHTGRPKMVNPAAQNLESRILRAISAPLFE